MKCTSSLAHLAAQTTCPQLALDPLPLQQQLWLIHNSPSYNNHARGGARTQSYTFIIYCGNVLNAWLNTATQVYGSKVQSEKWVRPRAKKKDPKGETHS